MKRILLLAVIASSNFLFAQQICMVSADYQTGENILVMWEWPASTAGIDSVLVYRKSEGENSFTKIGGTAVGQLSTFTDYTAITTIWNAYRISYKYTGGGESGQSAWHKPMVLDYGIVAGTTTEGQLTWTEYQIEGVTSSTFVIGYTCFADQTGLGNFTEVGSWTGTTLAWWDQAYAGNPSTQYMVEVELPNCNINKANINTSRSNIKKQTPNAEVGIETLELNTLGVSPNPVEDKLTIGNIDQISSLNILDCNGKIVFSSAGNSLSNAIDLSELKSGIYLVEAFNADGARFSNKIVKL